MRVRPLAFAMAAGAAFGCAAGPGAKPRTPSSPPPSVPASPRAPAFDSTAVAEGRELAARLFGRDPLSSDTRLLRYVALVGRTCAGAGGEGWRFAVTQSTIPYATAFPGRLVVISRGLLVLVGSEAELAVVLSREICRSETSPSRDFP